MRRARTSAASSAAALLYSVGMPIMISRAFVPHIPHSTRHCQLHPVQLHLSAKKVPSFKPAWDSPRRIPVGARRNPGATTEAARDVDSAASVVATAAADARAVSEEAVAGDDATSSTTRPRPKTYSYSKAAWRPSPVSNERKGGGSSSNSALETPAALKQSASTTAVPSDATAAPATTAPTTPGASSAAATPPPPRPALEAVAVPPTRSEPVQSPTAAAAAGVDEATVETPTASSTLAEPPATPTMPLKPSGGGSAAAEAIAISLRQVKDVLAPFSKKIQDNIAEGTFGERGEEWAILQVVILLCVGLGTVPLVGGLVTTLAGPGLAAVGIAVAAAGASGLGQSLSPWPAPVKDNHLKTDGIFGIIRHPAYTGLVMFCLGFGVMTDSPLRMLLAVLLGVVLDKKVEKEEKMLVDMHGEAYEEYISKVAKFLPGVY